MTGQHWEGFPPAQVDLDCSGQTHWVRWEAGGLIPLNHPDASERTLAALARQHVPCFELMQLWERHVDDLRVLALASRGPGDPLAAPIQGPGQSMFAMTRSGMPSPLVRAPGPFRQTTSSATGMSRAVLRAVPPARRSVAAAPMSPMAATAAQGGPMDEPLVRLLGMAGPLADRLVATVAATWVERLAAGHEDGSKHLPALRAALYGRVVASVRTWLGAPRVRVHVEMLAEEGIPSATRDDAAIRVSVPFGWIAHVWARGLAVLLGRLVLGVEEATETRMTLLAVSPDFGETARVTITVG